MYKESSSIVGIKIFVPCSIGKGLIISARLKFHQSQPISESSAPGTLETGSVCHQETLGYVTFDTNHFWHQKTDAPRNSEIVVGLAWKIETKMYCYSREESSSLVQDNSV